MQGQYMGKEGGERLGSCEPCQCPDPVAGRSEVPGQWCRLRTQIIDTEDLNISVSQQLTPPPLDLPHGQDPRSTASRLL